MTHRPAPYCCRLRVFPFAVATVLVAQSVGHGADAGAERTGASAAQSFSPPAMAPMVAPSTAPATTAIDQLPVYVVPYGIGGTRLADQMQFERERMLREWSEQAMEPQPIYFPPAPPVLGAPLPGVGLFADDVVRSIAPYVSEPFYAPLSTRVAEEDLGRRARARLEAYQRDKAALLAQLRAVFEGTRSKSTAARRSALEALAAKQAPALEALENTADELRREFFRTRFSGGGGDWNHYRAWHLSADEAGGAEPTSAYRMRELRVLRAAVFYQDGLSIAQRRLLREVVMGQSAALHTPGAGLTLPANDTSQVIFFSPHTARIALPSNLPGDVAALVDDYVARKDALKQELRNRIVSFDADRNATRRTRALQQLADEQAARLEGLEDLADQIRERLAPLVQAQGPAAPAPLPGALEGRVAAYLRDKNELQRVAQERLAVALAEFDQRDKDERAAKKPERRAAVVRTAVDAFHADEAAKIAALNAEAESIRGELVRHTAARGGSSAGKSIDVLLRDFADAFKQQQLANLYAEYRIAALEPGLSAAQRRLLFDAAIADLKLPGAIRDQQVSADELATRP